MFWTKLPLAPLANGERDWWAMLKVDFPKPITAAEASVQLPPGTPPIVGYYRNLGIRTKGDIRFRLTDLAGDDFINWADSDVKEIDPKSLDRRIRKYITAPDKQGIWYASNKVFIQSGQTVPPNDAETA